MCESFVWTSKHTENVKTSLRGSLGIEAETVQSQARVDTSSWHERADSVPSRYPPLSRCRERDHQPTKDSVGFSPERRFRNKLTYPTPVQRHAAEQKVISDGGWLKVPSFTMKSMYPTPVQRHAMETMVIEWPKTVVQWEGAFRRVSVSV